MKNLELWGEWIETWLERVSPLGLGYDQTEPAFARQRARFATAMFSGLGLIFLLLTGTWWPGVLFLLGLTIVLHQLLRSRYYEAVLSLLIFGATYVTAIYRSMWLVVFATAALTLFAREFLGLRGPRAKKSLEDMEEEIEDEEDQ